MLKVTVDFSGMNKKLAEVIRLTKEEPAKVMIQEGRLLCVELAKATQPFGFDDKAKASGQDTIARDIAKVYAAPAEVFKAIELQNGKEMADGFWKAFQARSYAKATRILQDSHTSFRGCPILPFDGGTAHKKRWSRGQVKGGFVASMVLQTQTGMKPYIKQEQAKVGFAKGGWSNAAKLLGGTRGIPAWVANHNTPASIVDNTSEPNPSLIIRNEVNYTSQVLSATGASDALKDREIKLTERIRKILGSKFHALQSK